MEQKEMKKKELLEAAKELYETLHNLPDGDGFEDWDGMFSDAETLEEFLEDKISVDGSEAGFKIDYEGEGQVYEFVFWWDNDNGWWLGGMNGSDTYYYDTDIDEIKGIMDEIREAL